MRSFLICLVDTLYTAHVVDEHVYDITCRYAVAVIRTDIIPRCETAVLKLLLDDHEISHYRLENMLIRSRRIRISYYDVIV